MTPVTRRSPSRLASALPLGAVACAVLFTAAWITLSFISDGYTVGGDRIEPYSNVTQPVSGLGMGVTAPYMNTVFVLSGLLLAAGLVGLHLSAPKGRARTRIPAAVGLALAPVGLVLIGLFDLDAPGLHFTGAALAFQLPILSLALAGLHLRGNPEWRRTGNLLLAVAAPITLVLVAVFTATFDQAATAAGEGIAGLTQRIWLTWVLACFAVLGWTAHRRTAA